jgi:hypothetical protein
MATLDLLPASHFSIATQNSPSLHYNPQQLNPLSLYHDDTGWGVIKYSIIQRVKSPLLSHTWTSTADYRLDHLGRLSLPVPVPVHRDHKRVSRRGSGQCGVVSTSHRSRLWTWLPSTALTSTSSTSGRSDRQPCFIPQLYSLFSAFQATVHYFLLNSIWHVTSNLTC